MKRAILFDLDGTVLDSKRGVFRSIEYAMTQMELPMPPKEELIAFLGPPIQIGFKEVCHVPTEQVETAIRYYREYYNERGKFEATIYQGIPALIIALKNAGKECYITTSKPRYFATQILEHFGILELFDNVYGCELDGKHSEKSEVVTLCLREHHIVPEEAVLIGDRLYDVQGAKAVRMECIGVLYGYGAKKELVDAGADDIAEDVAALYRLLL